MGVVVEAYLVLPRASGTFKVVFGLCWKVLICFASNKSMGNMGFKLCTAGTKLNHLSKTSQ